jgi:peptidoglycan/LPS O-acetylase OafA/YrhL
VNTSGADSTTRRSLAYLPQLDGLRALAIGGVLLLHAWMQTFKGGWIGVMIFFVLSGYLITTLLIAEFERQRSIAIGRFYIRRVLRLMPAYWLMLATYAVAYIATAPSGERGSRWHEFWVALTYQTNFHVTDMPQIGFTWTLAIEEQFYLIWPLIVLACLSARRGRAALLAVTTALTVAFIVGRVVMAIHGAGWATLYNTPQDALLIGCLAAQVSAYPAVRRVASNPLIPWIALGVCAVLLVTTDNVYSWLYAGPLTGLCILFAASILALVQQRDSLAVRWLSKPFMTYIGKISYSLYLWNLFSFDAARHFGGGIVRVVLGVLLAFALAVLTRELVEKPVAKWRTRFESARANRSSVVAPVEPSAQQTAPAI